MLGTDILIKEDLELFCMKTCKIVSDVAVFIESKLGKVNASEIKEKSQNNLVSFVDLTAEMMLVEGLGRLLPGSVFITEEATMEKQDGDYQWIIDPLDGTTNFLRQLPYFAISVALQYQQQTLIAVVYEIVRKECFYAWQNGGAFLNSKKIKVSTTLDFKKALIATGLPDQAHDNKLKHYLTAFKYLQQNTLGLRRYGAAAIDLVYVACGRFDAFFQYELHPWDVAAGALIVQEAGGIVTDFKGEENYLFGKEIIASNRSFAYKFLGIIQAIFHQNKHSISNK